MSHENHPSIDFHVLITNHYPAIFRLADSPAAQRYQPQITADPADIKLAFITIDYPQPSVIAATCAMVGKRATIVPQDGSTALLSFRRDRQETDDWSFNPHTELLHIEIEDPLNLVPHIIFTATPKLDIS